MEGEGNTVTEGKVATRIKPKLELYRSARSASGSKVKISGDDVSNALEGMTLQEVYDVAAHYGITKTYPNLNAGHQRMCLGNLIRGAVKKKDAPEFPMGIRKAADERIERDKEANAEKQAARVERAKERAAKKAEAKVAAPAEGSEFGEEVASESGKGKGKGKNKGKNK